MKPKLILVLLLCLFAAGSGLLYLNLVPDSEANVDLAMAEMQVSKLTCGSCVETITAALKEISGVEDVEVSVTTGVGKVTFDPDLVDAQLLVATVTESGYPASLRDLLSREQYRVLKTEESRLAADYVARIGDQLISRAHFAQQYDQYAQMSGQQARPEARSQALLLSWQNLMQRTLLLQAAEKNQILVLDGEVDLRIDKLRSGMPNFSEYVVTKYGSEEHFRKQLKEDMIISRNIDQVVLENESDQQLRQQKFSRWFQDVVDNAAIVIYDPELKQAAGSAGGCCGGGSCGAKG